MTNRTIAFKPYRFWTGGILVRKYRDEVKNFPRWMDCKVFRMIDTVLDLYPHMLSILDQDASSLYNFIIDKLDWSRCDCITDNLRKLNVLPIFIYEIIYLSRTKEDPYRYFVEHMKLEDGLFELILPYEPGEDI